jgi:hypothetical protein
MLKSLQVLKCLALGMLIVLAAPFLNTSLVGVSQEPMNGRRTEAGDAAIAALEDGTYQFCSKPDPMDWRDGAGSCFIFKKTDRKIAGYYGYPNSDNFICIEGTADANLIRGKGLAPSWSAATWSKVPEAEFPWDTEGRLKLSEGKIVRSVGEGENRTDWIRFPIAVLDVRNFYQYRSPRMTSPSQLCDLN